VLLVALTLLLVWYGAFIQIVCMDLPWKIRTLPITRFFFFSSRRRHTRSKRDWSSDVCSSDLMTNRRNKSRLRYLAFYHCFNFARWPLDDDRCTLQRRHFCSKSIDT